MLAKVRALRPHWAVGSYQPGDWLPHPALPHFEWARTRHPKEVVAGLGAAARRAFLVDMITAHAECWLEPKLAAGETVVMDSYHIRFWAREEVRGGAPAAFGEMFNALPAIDHAVLLQLSAADAAARKPGFEAHELRGAAGDRAEFEAFQAEVFEVMRRRCEAVARRVSLVDAGRSPSEVAEAFVAAVEGAESAG